MAKRKCIVVIGASAGGGVLLPELVQQFTVEMNIVVFVVMHLSDISIGTLITERLQKHTPLKCKLARHKEPIKSGHIYLAVPDQHMIIKENRILLGNGPMENRYRPSIDVLFRSAAVEAGPDVIGIVLSGLLEDGSAGMVAIRRAGGTCIIQSPDEARYPDMPLAVARHLKPDFSIPVEGMGNAVEETLSKRRKKTPIPKELIKEALIAERVSIGIDYVKELGKNSLYSCPDCGGGLWEIQANGEKNYRCHVGHAFSQQSLLTAMGATTESALWTALRIIEERRNLLHELSSKNKGRKKIFHHYTKRISELEKQIDQLKTILFITQKD